MSPPTSPRPTHRSGSARRPRGPPAQFASVAAGAPAPLLATALLKDYGASTPISLYVTMAGVLTVVAVVCARETRGRDLANLEQNTATNDDQEAAATTV